MAFYPICIVFSRWSQQNLWCLEEKNNIKRYYSNRSVQKILCENCSHRRWEKKDWSSSVFYDLFVKLHSPINGWWQRNIYKMRIKPQQFSMIRYREADLEYIYEWYVCLCTLNVLKMKKNYDLISKSSRFCYKWVLKNAPIKWAVNVRLCYF